MINEDIAQLQAQLAEVDDNYLAEQAKNPSGMTGLMAAIEMSKRSKMRSRAAAVSDSYAHKDGTVVQDTLSQFQAAQAPASAPQGYANGGIATQGYADGGSVREYGVLDWRDQFMQDPPWHGFGKDYVAPPPFKSVGLPNEVYGGLGKVGRRELAALSYDRSKNPQSPSPDYDMPAGPDLPPEAISPWSPYDEFDGLPIGTSTTRQAQGGPAVMDTARFSDFLASMKSTPDPVGEGVSDALQIAGMAGGGADIMGQGPGGGRMRSAVREGNASSPAGTPNFESEYEKLLAGIKSDAPEKLKPPRELDQIDTARVERLNRAMALGAMAKQFATNNDFVAGFGTGASDAATIMAGGRERLQAEQIDRAKVQSQYDIANSDIQARERLANIAASNNINLSRVEAGRDVAMQDREFANSKDLARMEIEGQGRIASIRAQHEGAARQIEQSFRIKLAKIESADAKGMWQEKADLERELAGIQLASKELDAQANRDLRLAISLNSNALDYADKLVDRGETPVDAHAMAREAIFGRPQTGLPTVQRVKP